MCVSRDAVFFRTFFFFFSLPLHPVKNPLPDLVNPNGTSWQAHHLLASTLEIPHDMALA